MARGNEVERDELFGSAIRGRPFGGVSLTVVFLGLWAVLWVGAIVAAAHTSDTRRPDDAVATLPEKSVSPRLADSPRGESPELILARALARVRAERPLAGAARSAQPDGDPLVAASGCVPCQLCLFSEALEESSPSPRDGAAAALRP